MTLKNASGADVPVAASADEASESRGKENRHIRPLLQKGPGGHCGCVPGQGERRPYNLFECTLLLYVRILVEETYNIFARIEQKGMSYLIRVKDGGGGSMSVSFALPDENGFDHAMHGGLKHPTRN